MFLRNKSAYSDHEVRALIEFAAAEIDMRRVCVNVRGGRGGGRAYNGIPYVSNAPPSAEYLITIRLPATVGTFKHGPGGDFSYDGPRFPSYQTHGWQEYLIAIAAHEAKHIEQFREDLSHSEVKCERFALYMLRRYRNALAVMAAAKEE